MFDWTVVVVLLGVRQVGEVHGGAMKAYWCIAAGLIPVLRAVGGGRGAICGCTTALAWEGMGGTAWWGGWTGTTPL